MELYDLLEVDHLHPKEEWRSVTTTSGALSVMTHGTVWMPVLLASKWAIAMKVKIFVNYSRDIRFIIIGATGQRGATYGQGTGPIQLSQVQCVGNEAGILNCPGSTATQNCQHDQDAGVTCIAREYHHMQYKFKHASRIANTCSSSCMYASVITCT